MSGPADLSDDDLVAHALAVHVLAGDDTEVYDACVAELQERGTPSIADRALSLLDDHRPEARALGADVLGLLGAEGGTTYRDRSAGPLLALAEAESDPLVLDSVVAALGHVGGGRALSVVLGAATHGSYRVRSSAARAMPSLAGAGVLDEDDPVVSTLMALAADPDAEVRNWAVFGLASGISCDGLRVRSALHALLRDADDDTSAEAMVGLARRHDPSVVPVVAAALDAAEVGRLAVESAKLLGDHELLPGLQGLVGWWDVDEPLLVAAIEACTSPTPD